jgi:hypothetical protein
VLMIRMKEASILKICAGSIRNVILYQVIL